MVNLDRNKTIIISVVIIAVLILSIFLLYTKFYGTEPVTITTQGSSQLKVMPELVSVYVYTQIVDKSSEAAKNKNAEVINKVLLELEKIGIKKEDIETEQYNINPNYDWNSGEQKITGYTASQNLNIKTKDFDLTGKIVDAAVNSGALISYINFEISKEKENELKAQLLSDASKDARVKADSIASGLGKKVIDVLSVQTSDYSYMPYPIFRAEAGVAVEKAVTEITPKQLELNAQVSATFKIS